MTIKLMLPPGTIHFANIYQPLVKEGSMRPMYGFSIDREYLEGFEEFNELFVKTPGSREVNSIPATCKRRPEVIIADSDIDAMVDAHLECQARNISLDTILVKNRVEIEVEFFDLGTVGRKGIGLSLKSVTIRGPVKS